MGKKCEFSEQLKEVMSQVRWLSRSGRDRMPCCTHGDICVGIIDLHYGYGYVSLDIA